LDTIATNWSMSKELATDLLKLALFDVVILVDDSGEFASLQFCEWRVQLGR